MVLSLGGNHVPFHLRTYLSVLHDWVGYMEEASIAINILLRSISGALYIVKNLYMETRTIVLVILEILQ